MPPQHTSDAGLFPVIPQFQFQKQQLHKTLNNYFAEELPQIPTAQKFYAPPAFRYRGIRFIQEFHQINPKSETFIYKEQKTTFNIKIMLELFICDENNTIAARTSVTLKEDVISINIRTVDFKDISPKYIVQLLQKAFDLSLEKILKK